MNLPSHGHALPGFGLPQSASVNMSPPPPELISVAPPLLDFEDELVWLDFGDQTQQQLIFENPTNYINANAMTLMEQAFKQSLSPQGLQIVLDELAKNTTFMDQVGLTPTKLPQLVENNPIIAIEFLLKLMNKMEITEYLHVIVNMEITLHSLEVVNRLCTTVNLPIEFLHLYTSNCISTCETMKDKYMQTRLARLVCVFLQSLIRKKILNVKELFIEIEAFCVSFSRIKEAAILYRLLKNIDCSDAPVPIQSNGSPAQSQPSSSNSSLINPNSPSNKNDNTTLPLIAEETPNKINN